MAFASGKYSYGICDITGFRYKLQDMKKTWDPQAIRNARPDVDEDNTKFLVYTNVGDGKLGAVLDTFSVTTSVGEVTITT